MCCFECGRGSVDDRLVHGHDGWQVKISVVHEEWSKMICEHPKSLRHQAMLKVISMTEGEEVEKEEGVQK